ncbi:MAG: hypothetical protein RL220_1650, partial [Bacteroidota bacterium]
MIKRILSILFVFMCSHMYAQQYSFVQYNVRNGLAQSQVRCMIQDSRGYIWAGTLGGVSRFDGRHFENFDRQDGLPSNQVNCLFELPDGSIAAGGNGGVALISPFGISTLSLGDAWRDASVNCIHGTDSKNLMIGTENGVFSVKDGTITGPFAPQEDGADVVRSFITRGQELLVVTRAGIYKMNQLQFQPYYIPPPEITLFDAVESGDTLWMGTRDLGLLYYHQGRIRAYGPAEGLPSTSITRITRGNTGHLWLCSRFGFYKTDGQTFTVFDEKNGLPTPDVRDIIQDR